MIRSVVTAITIVKTMTDTIENHKLAVTAIDIDGLTIWMASLVNSVRTASSGLISILTLKALATLAKPSASPASGCRPTLKNAVPASGISTR